MVVFGVCARRANRGNVAVDQPDQPRRFLVLEDEPMISMLLEDYISDMGHEMAWQAETIDGALRLIEMHSNIDAAILDMNIRGELSDPVAEALKALRIPFCFMTGYGAGATTAFRDALVIGKPFDIFSVQQAVNMLLAGVDDR
jgi:DNA-binding response OmpR family regulator